MHTIVSFLIRCLNLHTLYLFIGFAVGFATAYTAVIWPPRKKVRPQ